MGHMHDKRATRGKVTTTPDPLELARAAAQREQEAEPTPGRVRGLVHQFDPMAASRAARKREMIANLDNDVYIKALVDEAYATIFTGSTTNTVAQKKVARIFEAEGCHIGASAKHDTWADKNGSFESVDAFLSSDNSAGSVRDQLAIYTLFLMCDTRLRYERSGGSRTPC